MREGGAEADSEVWRGGGGDTVCCDMANVRLEFKASAGDGDPQTRPILILGQLPNLQRLPWAEVRGKLQPRVTEEVSTLPAGLCLLTRAVTQGNRSGHALSALNGWLLTY